MPRPHPYLVLLSVALLSLVLALASGSANSPNDEFPGRRSGGGTRVVPQEQTP